MATAFVNIGSNLGDRAALIERAVAGIEEHFGPGVRRAPMVESLPWGYESPLPFLNLGIAFDTVLPPEEILQRLKAVERSICDAPHRAVDGGYVDRQIDIDFIALDDVVLSTPALTLPHPRMHLRRFVLEPLLALAPDWRHPLLRLTPAELLTRL